jgi:biotin operon repressor
MKKDEAIASVLMVQEILQSQSDEQHRISMPELSAALELEGVPSGRRVIYACVQALKNRGVPVHFSRSGGKQGYWIDHLLTPAEAFVVTDLITQSPSLSSETAERLSDRIRGLLSEAD